MVDSNQRQFYVPVILGSTRRRRQGPKGARFIAGRMSRSEVLWFACRSHGASGSQGQTNAEQQLCSHGRIEVQRSCEGNRASGEVIRALSLI